MASENVNDIVDINAYTMQLLRETCPDMRASDMLNTALSLVKRAEAEVERREKIRKRAAKKKILEAQDKNVPHSQGKSNVQQISPIAGGCPQHLEKDLVPKNETSVGHRNQQGPAVAGYSYGYPSHPEQNYGFNGYLNNETASVGTGHNAYMNNTHYGGYRNQHCQNVNGYSYGYPSHPQQNYGYNACVGTNFNTGTGDHWNNKPVQWIPPNPYMKRKRPVYQNNVSNKRMRS